MSERNAQIRIGAWRHGGWTRWTVTFANPEQLLAYIERKLAFNRAEGNEWNFNSHFSFEELEDEENEYGHRIRPLVPFGPIEETILKVLEILYPQCHHGMDASLCMDPYGENHFGTREQELQGIL